MLKKTVFFFIGNFLNQTVRGQIKTRALIVYLKTLQALRRSLVLGVAVFVLLQLMTFGFLGTVVTGIWLWPDLELSTKLCILMAFFATLFLLPFIGLIILLSDRLWYRLSNVEKLQKL